MAIRYNEIQPVQQPQAAPVDFMRYFNMMGSSRPTPTRLNNWTTPMVAEQPVEAQPVPANTVAAPEVISPPLAAPMDNYSMPYNQEPPSRLADLVKEFEGFRSTAYDDHGQKSIGYGMRATNPNEVIDEAEASRRLQERLAADRGYIDKYAKEKGYNWNNNQRDALTSFIYNLGSGALDQLTAGGKRSIDEVADMMLEYNKAGGKTLDGLVRRRQAESNLYRS